MCSTYSNGFDIFVVFTFAFNTVALYRFAYLILFINLYDLEMVSYDM